MANDSCPVVLRRDFPTARADGIICVECGLCRVCVCPGGSAVRNASGGGSVMHLPTEAKERKALPIVTGVLDYFPDAIAAVAELSRIGNDQHNPGQPLHWAKDKSADHADCIGRHMLDRGTRDTDGVRHSAKVAWRALALLQTEIENERS